MSREPIRLADARWDWELTAAIRADSSEVRIVSHFIKERALERLLPHRPYDIQVITRFNLADFADGVNDVKALRMLLDTGGSTYSIRKAHIFLPEGAAIGIEPARSRPGAGVGGSQTRFEPATFRL